MKIGVVGAGPAGTWASILLAKRGHAVTLFDPQAPWEKPCGGGVTTRVLSGFGLAGSGVPRNFIDKITIFFGDKNAVSVVPEQPLAVLSRHELAKYLVQEARQAGVLLIPHRVSHFHKTPGLSGWTISTRESELQVDFLIGADGATSFVRRTVGKALRPEDLSVTLGYFIPSAVSGHMKIYFVPSFEGYIWSFPRPNHISYGLITRALPGWTGRARMLLANFILADLGSEALEQAEFYSAPVPCLGPNTWKTNQVYGDRWALVGDAAGLADPITGEGIYFAFRSAEILAETIERPDGYAARIWSELGCDLARGSEIYQRFYHGRFLAGDFRKRTIQLSRHSRTLKTILGSLVTGNQPYIGLKKRLFRSIPSIGVDLVTRRV